MKNRVNDQQYQENQQEIGAYTFKSKSAAINEVLDKSVNGRIKEKFENCYNLYNYMTINLKLQMNDDQIRNFETSTDEHPIRLLIINFGLHLKGSQNKYLYGITVMDCYNQQCKYLWDINKYLSEDEIQTEFKLNIDSNELPKPSQISYFDKNSIKKDINRLINNPRWISKYHDLKPNSKQDIILNGYKLVIDTAEWIKACTESLNNDALPLIPVGYMNDDDKPQIAYIKIIYIESKDVYAGIQYEPSLVPTEFKQIFSSAIIKYIGEYSERLSFVPDPRFICYSSAAISASQSISSDEMNKYSPWATDIKICDNASLNQILTTVANKYNCPPDIIIKGFNETAGRREFSALLKEQGKITIGKSSNIHRHLDELGLISSKTKNLQLNDFTPYLEKVLQQQSKSQQETITRLDEAHQSNDNFAQQIQYLQHEAVKYKQALRVQQIRNQEFE
mmetsp:Transcript_14186/g.12703  ORF Transcript_14186/g.12703 Transcript_14186/m.12703 type:complete len:450 (+) Transcript_14186:88-1437(+)